VEAEKRSKWPLAVACVVAGVVVFAGLLVWLLVPAALGHKPYRVPSESMKPTIGVGTRLTANKRAYHGGAPKVGDIVVFHPPRGADTNTCGARHADVQPCGRPAGGEADVTFIKRVVALGGDTVALRDGHVIRNGRAVGEPFIARCAADYGTGCDFPRPVRVPAGHAYMLGDNRGESDDSRFFGPVPYAWIIGRVEKCGFLSLSCHAWR
jgi:signal peptidase I